MQKNSIELRLETNNESNTIVSVVLQHTLYWRIIGDSRLDRAYRRNKYPFYYILTVLWIPMILFKYHQRRRRQRPRHVNVSSLGRGEEHTT